MAATMYNLQSLTVDPIDNLLKSLVAVNAYAIAAGEAGWAITFVLSDNEEQIGVKVERLPESWPTDIDGEQAK